MRDPSDPPPALQRLHARRRNPRTWRPDDLERLEEAYAACPKLWWHVGAVVPAQVDLVTTARALRQLPRLSASLLDAVALANNRREVSNALQVLLRLVAHRRPVQAWATLQDAALAFLHVDEGRYDPPGPLPDLLRLAPWATPLTTPAALANHGRQLNTCLSERSWWRLTRLGLGRAYALCWEGEAATLWLVPDTAAGARVDMLTGPGNAPASAALQAAVQTALAAALLDFPRPFASHTREPPLPAVSEECLYRARHTLLDATGPGGWSPSPIPMAERSPEALPRLPTAHWTEHHDAFAWQACFGLDSIRIEPGDDGEPPRASVAWDPATGGLVYTIPQGFLTLLPTAPPTLHTPSSSWAGNTPCLWFTLDVEAAHQAGLPDRAVHAMASFRTHLPPRVVFAARHHTALQSLPGVWLLCSVPELEPVLDAAPLLAGAVVTHAAAHPETTSGLATAVRSGPPTEQVQAVLAWLGVPTPQALATRLSSLGDAFWSPSALRTLGELLAVPAAFQWLERLHTWLPSHALLLAAAQSAGLLRTVTLRLLNDLQVPAADPWLRSRLETAFAELAAAADETNRPTPRIQGLSHLARLLVHARPHVPRVPPPPADVPGPWGAPVTDPTALASLATELGHDPDRWQRAAQQGDLCCIGLPAGQATITWLRPAGRRGALALVGALSPSGRPASPAAQRALEAGLSDHHRRLDRLEPGWCGEEALQAGLSLDLGQVTLAGREPLGSLVEGVLGLCR